MLQPIFAGDLVECGLRAGSGEQQQGYVVDRAACSPLDKSCWGNQVVSVTVGAGGCHEGSRAVWVWRTLAWLNGFGWTSV